jgi:hypothetical protein
VALSGVETPSKPFAGTTGSRKGALFRRDRRASFRVKAEVAPSGRDGHLHRRTLDLVRSEHRNAFEPPGVPLSGSRSAGTPWITMTVQDRGLMAERVFQSQGKVKVLLDVPTEAEWRDEFERAGGRT